jgi:hypothetical protein
MCIKHPEHIRCRVFLRGFRAFLALPECLQCFLGDFGFLLDALSGFRSLELSFSGQRRLPAIRVWALVPRIVFFGPAVPCSYSNLGFCPSNHLPRASSAVKPFETGLWSLELSSLGQRCLQVIRGWASVPQIVFFGPAVPLSYSRYLSLNFGPSNHPFRANSASILFRYGSPNPRNAFLGCWCLHSVRISADAFSNLSFGLSLLLNQHTQILVAIYQFRCRMSKRR